MNLGQGEIKTKVSCLEDTTMKTISLNKAKFISSNLQLNSAI